MVTIDVLRMVDSICDMKRESNNLKFLVPNQKDGGPIRSDYSTYPKVIM
jgi:hypothetical protein